MPAIERAETGEQQESRIRAFEERTAIQRHLFARFVAAEIG